MSLRRILSWALVAILLATVLVAAHTSLMCGWKLRTGLFDLLPRDQGKVGKLLSLVDGRLSRELVVLVGHRDPAVAARLAGDACDRLEGSGTASAVQARMPEGMEQAWWEMLRDHLPRLLPDSVALAADHGDTALLARRVQDGLYLPYSVLTPDRDPFQLASGRMSGLARPGWSLCGRFPCREDDSGTTWVLVRATLKGGAFDGALQDRLAPLLKGLALRTKNGGGKFLSQGVVIHAAHERSGMIREMGTVGIVSALGILLVFLAAFRTPLSFVAGAATVVVGIAVGFVWTHALFGGVHALTLAFGASVTGLCADYAIFLLVRRAVSGTSWNPDRAVATHARPLFLALATTILSFVGLLFSGFPGLIEIAVFSSVGLLVSWLFALSVLPALFARAALRPPVLLNRLSRAAWKVRLRPARIALALLALASALGMIRLRSDDDVRRLQTPAPVLQANDSLVSSLLQGPDAGRAVIVEAPDPETLLRRLEALDATLASERAQGRIREWISLSQTIPSEMRQRQDSVRVERLCRPPLSLVPTRLGVSPAAVDSFLALSRKGVPPLELRAWLLSPASWGTRELLLDTLPWRAAVPVIPAALGWNLPPLPGCLFVNSAELYTTLLSGQSRRSALLVAGMYLVTLFGLGVFLGFRRAVAVLTPALLAGAATLGVLGWAGIPLHFFGLMALTLVLGAGVDYALYLEDEASCDAPGHASVALCATTSLLSFGSLWACSSPALSQFGMVTVVGLAWSLLLSPWAPRLSRGKRA